MDHENWTKNYDEIVNIKKIATIKYQKVNQNEKQKKLPQNYSSLFKISLYQSTFQFIKNSKCLSDKIFSGPGHFAVKSNRIVGKVNEIGLS